MGKHVVKTALITLAFAIGGILLFAGACLLFFPQVVSNFAYNVGMYELSSTYAVRAYNEEKDSDEELATLVERAILAGDYEVTAKYGDKLLDSEDFEAIAQSHQVAAVSGSYYSYISGELAVAQYKLGNKNEALITVNLHTPQYVKFNATERLMMQVMVDSDVEFALKLKAMMESYVFDGPERNLLNNHLSLLEQFCQISE